MLISVVIRTYNESRYLAELLQAIRQQELAEHRLEIVIVDSGSTDGTLEIAREFGCRITHIRKEDFTFGRSLNVGCEFADGDVLLFVSGHCIPADETWLLNLISPIVEGAATYTYGRQVGRDSTKFSEEQIFAKFFPEDSLIPQEGFFCNNANSAIARDAWQSFRFNESLTGLEDMYLAKQLTVAGQKIAYVASAAVYHIHDESWSQVKLRYERESIALREIMPEIHLSLVDLIRCIGESVLMDWSQARANGKRGVLWSIICFRYNQFWGTYVGNHEHRKLSHMKKKRYYYPSEKFVESDNESSKNSGVNAAQSQ